MVETHHSRKPCNKVNEDVRLECKEVLFNFIGPKKRKKRKELLEEIGIDPAPMMKMRN